MFYVAFYSQGHTATGSLQVEEASEYCTVNHRASASNYQLSNMKCLARDLNWRPQRLEARTLTVTPPSPLSYILNLIDPKINCGYHNNAISVVISGSYFILSKIFPKPKEGT